MTMSLDQVKSPTGTADDDVKPDISKDAAITEATPITESTAESEEASEVSTEIIDGPSAVGTLESGEIQSTPTTTNTTESPNSGSPSPVSPHTPVTQQQSQNSNQRPQYTKSHHRSGNRGTGGDSSGVTTSKTNVYVPGLAPTFTDQDLVNMCSKYGDIVSAKAILDQSTGRCKGYGFVMFELQQCAQLAVDDLLRQGMQCSFAKETSARTHNRNGANTDYDDTNLYMANIPRAWVEEDLQQMLSPWGTVISTRVLRDNGGLSRGVGFARMELRDQCEAIIVNFNHMLLHGSIQPLQVRYADTSSGKMGVPRQYWEAQALGGMVGGGGNGGGGRGRKGSLSGSKGRGGMPHPGWNSIPMTFDGSGMMIMPGTMIGQNGAGAQNYYTHPHTRGIPQHIGVGHPTGNLSPYPTHPRYLPTPQGMMMAPPHGPQRSQSRTPTPTVTDSGEGVGVGGAGPLPNTYGSDEALSALSTSPVQDTLQQMNQQFQNMSFGTMMPQPNFGVMNMYGQHLYMPYQQQQPQSPHHQQHYTPTHAQTQHTHPQHEHWMASNPALAVAGMSQPINRAEGVSADTEEVAENSSTSPSTRSAP
eukprot:CFRG8207T1